MLFALFGFSVILTILACLVQDDAINLLILHHLPCWVLLEFRRSRVQLAVDADSSSGIGAPALKEKLWKSLDLPKIAANIRYYLSVAV